MSLIGIFISSLLIYIVMKILIKFEHDLVSLFLWIVLITGVVQIAYIFKDYLYIIFPSISLILLMLAFFEKKEKKFERLKYLVLKLLDESNTSLGKTYKKRNINEVVEKLDYLQNIYIATKKNKKVPKNILTNNCNSNEIKHYDEQNIFSECIASTIKDIKSLLSLPDRTNFFSPEHEIYYTLIDIEKMFEKLSKKTFV